MTYRLYGSPLSPYMRAAQIVFHEHGIDYEPMPIGPAELQAPAYAHRHPYRKLPALDADGERIFETSAIMAYVDELADPDTRLQPKKRLERARSNQWLSAANSYIYKDAFTSLYFNRALASRFGMEVDEDAIANGINKTAAHLTHVEYALAEHELGQHDRPALGDILVGCILVLLRDIEEGRKLLAPHARTTAWLERLAARASWSATTR